MTHKFFTTLSWLLLSLLICSCSKEDPGPSGGLRGTYWTPVHAKGELVAPRYTITWDDDIGSDGILRVPFYIGDETREYTMLFDGYHYYRHKGKNVVSSFSLTNPSVESNPRMYYVDGNKLYVEIVSGPSGFSSEYVEQHNTGKFVNYILDEFTPSRMTYCGVTYERIRK